MNLEKWNQTVKDQNEMLNEIEKEIMKIDSGFVNIIEVYTYCHMQDIEVYMDFTINEELLHEESRDYEIKDNKFLMGWSYHKENLHDVQQAIHVVNGDSTTFDTVKLPAQVFYEFEAIMYKVLGLK